jgi:hypothetical protein
MGSRAASRTWTLSPHVCADLSSDGGVLLDTAGGQCHALNSLGANICELLSGPRALTVDEILAGLSVPDDVSRDVVARDVHEFLEHLGKKGLLGKGSKRAAPSAGDDATTARRWAPLWSVLKFPPPVVSAYLLLIVHDVAMKLVGLRALRRVSPALDSTSPGSSGSRQSGRADALARSVDRAASVYYKHTWCLHRASVKCALLRIHGFPASVVIGFHRMPFYGHAWVELEGAPLGEKRPLHEMYRVVTRM